MKEALCDYLPSPRCVYLEINSACNLSCEICANAHRYGSGEEGERLSRQDIRDLLSQLPERPLKFIITGGEPLLHPELIGILEDLAEAEVQHALYTSASLPISEELFQALRSDMFLGHYTISLHSALPEEHERMTGRKGSFKQTVENIKYLQKTGIPIVVNSVLTETTPSDVLGTARYVLDLGACLAGFTKYIRPDGVALGEPLRPPSAERIRSVVQQIKEAGLSELAEVDCCHGCETGLEFHEACYSARAFCAVKPNGNVTPCIFTTPELGNIFDDSFNTIWNSAKAKKWREGISETCATCSLLDDCLGGCRAMKADPRLSVDICKHVDSSAEEHAETPLYKHLKITPVFDWKRGEKGVFLFHGKHARHFPASEIPLLEAIDREPSLEEVFRNFGPTAVDTVYDLYLDHMVHLS